MTMIFNFTRSAALFLWPIFTEVLVPLVGLVGLLAAAAALLFPVVLVLVSYGNDALPALKDRYEDGIAIIKNEEGGR